MFRLLSICREQVNYNIQHTVRYTDTYTHVHTNIQCTHIIAYHYNDLSSTPPDENDEGTSMYGTTATVAQKGGGGVVHTLA